MSDPGYLSHYGLEEEPFPPCMNEQPLTTEEVPEYLQHHLRLSGFQGSRLFTPEASQLLANYSRGVPKLVNELARAALALGYLKGASEIHASIVQRVIAGHILETDWPADRSRAVRITEPVANANHEVSTQTVQDPV